MLHSVEDIKDPTVTLVLHFPQTQKQACFATLRPWQNKDFIRLDFTGISHQFTSFVKLLIFLDREIEDKLEFVLKLISNSEPIK